MLKTTTKAVESKTKNSYTNLQTDQLVKHAQSGNVAAFDELYLRYKPIVENRLYQLAPDRNSVREDLCQEVFIKAFTSIKSLKNARAFKAWIITMSRNQVYDHLRKKIPLKTVSLSTPPYNDSTAEREIPDCRYSPEAEACRHELLACVKEAISQLPEHYRTAICLREIHHLDYQEIAARTHADLGTVKSRISRARAKVKVSLRHLKSVS